MNPFGEIPFVAEWMTHHNARFDVFDVMEDRIKERIIRVLGKPRIERVKAKELDREFDVEVVQFEKLRFSEKEPCLEVSTPNVIPIIFERYAPEIQSSFAITKELTENMFVERAVKEIKEISELEYPRNILYALKHSDELPCFVYFEGKKCITYIPAIGLFTYYDGKAWWLYMRPNNVIIKILNIKRTETMNDIIKSYIAYGTISSSLDMVESFSSEEFNETLDLLLKLPSKIKNDEIRKYTKEDIDSSLIRFEFAYRKYKR